MVSFSKILVLSFAMLTASSIGAGVAAAQPPVWMSPPDHTNHVVPGAHRCAVIGVRDKYGNRAAHCADLIELSFDRNAGKLHDHVRIWGQNQVFCQNAANAIVACAGIHETATTCSTLQPGQGGSSQGCTYRSGICGARFGHTPCGATRVTNSGYPQQNWSCSDESWGASVNDQVVLPRSGLVVGGRGFNVASGHYEVANGWVGTTAYCAY